MRTVKFSLNKGLNIGSPPTDLEPGEMTLARNCHYEPESQSLLKIKGRSTFGTIASAAATGLAFVSFRSAGRFLIGTAGTTLATAPVGTTGSFTSRKTLASTAGRMEAVYYNGTDRAYIVDGVNTAQVWTGSGNTRDLGLNSPTTAPTVTILGNAATQYPIGTTFSYCFTEYDSVNLVESGPSPVAQNQTTAANDTLKAVLPAKVNAAADKYRIYRTLTGGAVFFRLAEVATAITQYYDGSNTEGAAGNRQDNQTTWGFKTADDLFLSTRDALPMLGTPLQGNYITSNNQAPLGNILGVFENSLLISGVTSFPQDIYYSLPDSPEQFSPIYFLREENERGDPVTGFGVANDRLIAFTLNSIYRHDTLPRITDPGFGIGTASRQEVTKDHGSVAKRTIVNFGVGQPSNRLFYLSTRGPSMTDGYTTTPLGPDLNWDQSIVNFAQISNAVAVNFPKYQQIRLFVPSASSTTNDICFVYHYAPAHVKESTGVGKWTGPLHVRCAAAAVAYESNTETRLYVADTNTTGRVYLEDTGTTDAQNFEDVTGNINWEWQTGHPDFGSQSRAKKFHRVFLNYVGTDTFAPTFNYSVNQNDRETQISLANTTTNTAGTFTLGTSAVTKEKTRRMRGGIWQTGTNLRLRMQESSTTDRQIASLELELEDYGPSR